MNHVITVELIDYAGKITVGYPHQVFTCCNVRFHMWLPLTQLQMSHCLVSHELITMLLQLHENRGVKYDNIKCMYVRVSVSAR